MFPFLFQALRSAGVQVNSGGGGALRSPIATASSRSNNTNTNLNSSFRKKAVGSSPSNKKVSFSEPLSSPPPLLELLDKAFLDDDEEEEEEKESEEQEEEDDSANKSVSSPSDTLNIAFETAKEEEDCEKNDNADHSDLLRALESANLALVGDAKAVSGQDLARDSPTQSSPSSSNPSRASSLPSSPEVSVYELPRDKEPGKKTDSSGSNSNNSSCNSNNGLGKLRSIFGGRDSSIGDSSSLIGDRLKSLFGGSQQQQPVYQLTVEPKRDSEVKEQDSFETKVQGEEDSFERHEREFLEESRLAREEKEGSEKKESEKAGRLEVDVGGSRVRFFSGEDKSSSGEEESSDDADAAVNVYRVSETSGNNKSVILSGNLEGVAEKKVEALEDDLHEKDEEEGEEKEGEKSGGGFREVVAKDGEDSRFISGNIVVRYKK